MIDGAYLLLLLFAVHVLPWLALGLFIVALGSGDPKIDRL
jgi:hypothetical protein